MFKETLFYIVFIHIGTAFLCERNALIVPPCLDVFMVTRKKYGRNGFPLPDLGSGILRIFQKSAVNAFIRKAYIVRQHPGAEPCNAVRQD